MGSFEIAAAEPTLERTAAHHVPKPPQPVPDLVEVTADDDSTRGGDQESRNRYACLVSRDLLFAVPHLKVSASHSPRIRLSTIQRCAMVVQLALNRVRSVGTGSSHCPPVTPPAPSNPCAFGRNSDIILAKCR